MSQEEYRLPLRGERVGDYVMLGVVGEGAHGIVYKAESGGRLYAVKFFHAHVKEERSQREVSLLAGVSHPHVVRFLGAGRWPDVAGGRLYIAMEYVPGRTLALLLEQENPTWRELVRHLALPLARAQVAFHRAGLVHRDFKPTNILVRARKLEPVLVDLGVAARVGDARLTREREVPGTPEYRSPEAWRYLRDEQARGPYEPSPRDDVWAFGVTLFELCTRELPFGSRHDKGMVDAILQGEPRPAHELNPCIPKPLSELLGRLLTREPEARLCSAEALCEELEALAESEEPEWDELLFDEGDARKEESLVSEEPESSADSEASADSASEVSEESESSEASEPPEEAEGSGDAQEPRAVAPKEKRLGRWVLGGAVLGLGVLVVGGWLLTRREATEARAVRASEARAAPWLKEYGALLADSQACTGDEVASRERLPEAVAGAVPTRASTPAPVAPATRPQGETPVKSRPSQAAKSQKATPKPPPRVPEWFKKLPDWCKALGVAGALAHSACAPQTQQVPVEKTRKRVLGHVVSVPKPEDCPPEALQNHRALRLKHPMSEWFELVDPETADTWIKRRKGRQVIQVRAAEIQGWLRMPLGALPQETVLKGRLYFGMNWVFGRFTEAHLPGGDILPVCFELTDDDRQYGANGREIHAEQPEQGTVTINFGGGIRVVERFEDRELW